MPNSYVPSIDLSAITTAVAVAAADSALNVYASDAIGNKTDDLVGAVAADVGLMAYIKSLVQEIDQKSISQMSYGDVVNTPYVNSVNITDKGLLAGIVAVVYSYTSFTNVTIKIEIDGATIYDDIVFKTGAYGQSVSLPFHARFNTTLKVSGKHAAAAKGTTRLISIYQIDN